MNTRRELLLGLGAAAVWPRGAQAKRVKRKMLTRKIPATGEALPVIGMGTWQTFDVDPATAAPLGGVLELFFDAGGKVIDSSPMYGRAEQVVGDLVAGLGARERAFLATKVWTSGREDGVAQMRSSSDKLRAGTIDLMQVHNLVDWKTHLATLKAWKKEGRVRYIGVTHYQHGAFAELEAIVKKENVDFVQLPYSMTDRVAEKRLLPAARDAGVAVLVMQPFDSGALFARVKGREVPAWVAPLGITSWAQYFLKWILGHGAVTCPIPATSNPKHMADNLLAGSGALPDEATRRRMFEHLEA